MKNRILKNIFEWVESHNTLMTFVGGLFIAIAASVITAILSPLSRDDILNGISAAIGFLGMNIPIPLGVFGFLLVGFMVGMGFVLAPIIKTLKDRTNSGKRFLSYKKDEIYDVKWRWLWESYSFPKVARNTAYCVQCDHELEEKRDDHHLRQRQSREYLYCPKCDTRCGDYHKNTIDFYSNVSKEIERRARDL